MLFNGADHTRKDGSRAFPTLLRLETRREGAAGEGAPAAAKEERRGATRSSGGLRRGLPGRRRCGSSEHRWAHGRGREAQAKLWRRRLLRKPWRTGCDGGGRAGARLFCHWESDREENEPVFFT